MRNSVQTSRIVTILILVVVLAIILYLLGHNYFFERDTRRNTELISTQPEETATADYLEGNRIYHIIYDVCLICREKKRFNSNCNYKIQSLIP